MKWNRQTFHDFIKKQNVIGFYNEPIKLKSGRVSYWYVNWRPITSDAFLLDQLTEYILAFVNNLGLKPKCYYGVPEGATKIGLITQFKWAKSHRNLKSQMYPLAMGRGKEKDHGDPKDKFFLGMPYGETIILEDVTTTGGSLLDSIRKLKEANINIIAAIGLTNRNEKREDGKSVEKKISEENVNYYAMSNAIDLLPQLNINKEIAKNIEEYFKKYGTKQISFNNKEGKSID
jgi:orotate phosphoribosyltransferase